MPSLLREPPIKGGNAPLALLLAITMTGTIGLHIFVPAVPAAASALGASPVTAQLTITLYLAGLAIGQLVYGPLSDRFGRRPIILCSLAIYLVGLVLAVPAQSMGTLIVARVLQSLGGCGSLVLGRAMVRDISTPDDAARKIALLVTAMTLTPAIAPAIGGLVNGAFGWRAIFAVLAGIVGVLAALVVLTLPETNRRPVASVRIGAVVAGYGRLLRSSKFRHYLLAGAAGGTSLYAFLSAAPFLMIEVLGRSTQEVGLYCLLASAGMAAGSLVARQLVGRLEIRHAARSGVLISTLAGLILLGLALGAPLSVGALVAPVFLYSVGIGISSPNTVAGLMNVDPDAAGSASSLYGFCQMAVGMGVSLVAAAWHDGTAVPVAVTMLACSLGGLAALQRV